jgi:hypothetical protein
MAVETAKPRTFVRGFQTAQLAVLLAGLLLATLLLLTRLLLATLLLLTGLRLAALLLLTTLLLTTLLARLLVWILIHVLSSPILVRHFDRSFSMAGVNPRPLHSFHDSH